MVSRGVYYIEYVKPLPPIFEGCEYEDDISKIQRLDADEEIFRRVQEAELQSKSHLLHMKNEELMEKAMETLNVATGGGDSDTSGSGRSLLDELDLALADVQTVTDVTLKENAILRACIMALGGQQEQNRLEYLNYQDTANQCVDFELNETEMETLLKKLQLYFPEEADFQVEDVRKALEYAISQASRWQSQQLPVLKNNAGGDEKMTSEDENMVSGDDNVDSGDFTRADEDPKRQSQDQMYCQAAEVKVNDELERSAANAGLYRDQNESFTSNKEHVSPETVSEDNNERCSKLWSLDDEMVSPKKQKLTDLNQSESGSSRKNNNHPLSWRVPRKDIYRRSYKEEIQDAKCHHLWDYLYNS